MSTSLKLSKADTSDLNKTNKRPAPSQARLDKLKQLKSNKKNEISSVSLNGDHEVVSKPSVTRETAPILTEIETEVSMWKRRNGEAIPKMHMKGDS